MEKEKEERVINRVFAETDVKFLSACTKAGVEPTLRQASKFRNRRGRAYACRS